MRTLGSIKAIGAVALAIGLATVIATAGQGNQGNPGVNPPQSASHGRTYGEWAAAWWQWALSIPADHSPGLDATGADAAQGQSGPVWFLAGVFGTTEPVERTITIPSGKALFFPVINFVWISTGPTDPQTAEGIREIIEPAADAVTGLACKIDGVPVKHLTAYRAESPLFDVTLPAGDIFGAGPATYGPSMDQGYYLMLTPLSPGKHTIHFKGSMPATIDPYWTPFSLDVTYHITVKR
jgi:hypothetical protein